MKKKRPPKVRRRWHINPKTKVKKSDKIYKRSRQKSKLRRLLKEDE